MSTIPTTDVQTIARDALAAHYVELSGDWPNPAEGESSTRWTCLGCRFDAHDPDSSGAPMTQHLFDVLAEAGLKITAA